MAQTTLFSKSDIDRRVAEMGAEITRDLAGSDLIALCVLKGAMFFCSDLMRHIGFDVALDFIQVSSYGDQKTSSGVVTMLKEPQLDMRGKSVLIVEDIIDSGLSMNEVFRYIKLDRGAREVRTATFLDKPTARKIDVQSGLRRLLHRSEVRDRLRAGLRGEVPEHPGHSGAVGVSAVSTHGDAVSHEAVAVTSVPRDFTSDIPSSASRSSRSRARSGSR